jgi:hypothetical protein
MKRAKRRKRGQDRNVVSLARHRRFKQLAKAYDAELAPQRPRPGATASRMVAFAHRVERSLVSNHAMPSRDRDRSLIGDLADLEWRSAVLWHAIQTFARPKRRGTESDDFDARLMMLYSAVDSVRDVMRDLRGPMSRLLRSRCGYEGLSLAALASASAGIQGFKKPKGRKI